jgi:hypothetical protein
MTFKPDQPAQQEKGPRSFWYTDEKGERHELQGTLESESQEASSDGPRSFWYKDNAGKRLEIKGARSWYYDGIPEEGHERDFWKTEKAS